MAKRAEGLVMEVFRGKDGVYLRLVNYANNHTLMVSEAYVSMWNAKRAARKLGFEPFEVSR